MTYLPSFVEVRTQLAAATTTNDLEQLWYNVTTNHATSGPNIWASLTAEQRSQLVQLRHDRLAALARAAFSP